MSNKTHEAIANKIIEMLDAGTIPWRKPWNGTSAGMPTNGKSKKEYRGINVFMLHACGYSSPYWFSFNQAKEMGANVRKGEHGCPVIFWKLFPHVETNEAGELKEKKVPMLRYYTAFNAEQLENLPERFQPQPMDLVKHDPIEAAQKIIINMPKAPAIKTGTAAHYQPFIDLVTLPPFGAFHTPHDYYSTAFHELAHSTMHETRLNRKDKALAAFGSETYGKEELLAEFAASFLCGASGIDVATIENSAAYIASWKKTIKAAPEIVIYAAAQAQKAADWILGRLTTSEEVEA